MRKNPTVPKDPVIVGIEPFSCQLPEIGRVLHEHLELNLHCFYSTIDFRLRSKRKDMEIHILLLDSSHFALELLTELRSSKTFPVIICVENELVLQCVKSTISNTELLWFYKKESDKYVSLINLIREILSQTGTTR